MKHHYYFCKKIAFTLAEVLITLGIIGIVAALTMPMLINNIQKQKLESGFKHSYSVLSNALNKIILDHGINNLYSYYVDINSAGQTGQNVNIRFSDDFNKAFKNIYKCYSFKGYVLSNSACKDFVDKDPMWFVNNMYTMFDGTTKVNMHYNMFDIYLLPSGELFFVDANPSYGLFIYIDTNGVKKPNRLGYDFFPFHIDENGKLTAGGYYYGTSNIATQNVKDVVNAALSGVCVNNNRGGSYFKCLDI